MSDLKVKFAFKKETKGAVCFKEVDAAGKELEVDDIVIGTLYLRKSKLNGTVPKTLDVTVKTK